MGSVKKKAGGFENPQKGNMKKEVERLNPRWSPLTTMHFALHLQTIFIDLSLFVSAFFSFFHFPNSFLETPKKLTTMSYNIMNRRANLSSMLCAFSVIFSAA